MQIEQVPGEECEYRVRDRRDEQERDEPPPLTREHILGDEHDAVEDEPAGQGEYEKKHLADNKVEGHVVNGIAPEFSFEVFKQVHE